MSFKKLFTEPMLLSEFIEAHSEQEILRDEELASIWLKETFDYMFGDKPYHIKFIKPNTQFVRFITHAEKNNYECYYPSFIFDLLSVQDNLNVKFLPSGKHIPEKYDFFAHGLIFMNEPLIKKQNSVCEIDLNSEKVEKIINIPNWRDQVSDFLLFKSMKQEPVDPRLDFCQICDLSFGYTQELNKKWAVKKM